MYEKTILCLANSRKESGRCVAGREFDGVEFGHWIRPVSAREKRELSEDERSYEDGSDVAVAQVVTIPLEGPQPEHHQRENHLIDDGYFWTYVDDVDWALVETAIDHFDGALWENESSSQQGVNDRIPASRSLRINSSLHLLMPEELNLVVDSTRAGGYRKQVRAHFAHDGIEYRIVITDPVVERQYQRKGAGTYPIETSLLCVSLGEEFQGYIYKLAATVITPDRIGTRDK